MTGDRAGSDTAELSALVLSSDRARLGWAVRGGSSLTERLVLGAAAADPSFLLLLGPSWKRHTRQPDPIYAFSRHSCSTQAPFYGLLKYQPRWCFETGVTVVFRTYR